jgi:hypothetical protein
MKLLVTGALALMTFLQVARAADEVEWDIDVGLDDSIYPSLVIATSMIKLDDEEDETVLGDPMGMIGVAIVSPGDDVPVTVEISSGSLIKPSKFSGRLAEAGETYYIYPILKYDYQTLLSVRQPFPEVITAKVTVDGEELHEKSKRVPVRSINDCLLGFVDEEDAWVDLTWLMPAYVNENHPVVDEILAEALDAGDVDSFAGYQKPPDGVVEEIRAIWNAIQERGFRYSNITRSSGESDTVATQHVRLLGDAVRTAQANCVEGSVLFASILRKLDMNPFLVLIPGHAFVGAFLDEAGEGFICIETTMLGNADFDQAVESGMRQFKEHADYLLDEDAEAPGYALIDIHEARQAGIMPIRELTP